MTIKLSWGLQPPEGATIAWGARAIWRDGYIDLVYDRQSCEGAEPLTQEQRQRFARQLDDVMDAVRSEAKLAWLDRELQPSTPNRVVLIAPTPINKSVTVEADTRGSHGYLYLVAYKTGAP